jgi:hypothetical protein
MADGWDEQIGLAFVLASGEGSHQLIPFGHTQVRWCVAPEGWHDLPYTQ